jgi:hypothetical protein
MRLHVLDLLVDFVVLVEQTREMVVAGLELGDQFAEFGKHGRSPVKDVIFTPFSRIRLDLVQETRTQSAK